MQNFQILLPPTEEELRINAELERQRNVERARTTEEVSPGVYRLRRPSVQVVPEPKPEPKLSTGKYQGGPTPGEKILAKHPQLEALVDLHERGKLPDDFLVRALGLAANAPPSNQTTVKSQEVKPMKFIGTDASDERRVIIRRKS